MNTFFHGRIGHPDPFPWVRLLAPGGRILGSGETEAAALRDSERKRPELPTVGGLRVVPGHFYSTDRVDAKGETAADVERIVSERMETMPTERKRGEK